LYTRTESGDLLSVLDELDTDTLANGGVWLLGLNTDLLKNNALGVGGTSEWRGLVGGTEKSLLVVQVGPLLFFAVQTQLASCVQSSWLSFTHDCYAVLADVFGRQMAMVRREKDCCSRCV